MVDFEALKHFENPDLHTVSVKTMDVFLKIKEFVADLECPKRFYLQDLVKPQADRTELFLSALLNFVLHRYFLCSVFAFCFTCFCGFILMFMMLRNWSKIGEAYVGGRARRQKFHYDS